MKVLGETVVNGRLGKATARHFGPPGSLRFHLARSTLGVGVLEAAAMGLGFLSSVVLARLLGVREFGLYAFGWNIIGLLSLPATFGFPQLLVREIAAYRAKGEWGFIRGILGLAYRVTLLATLALILLAGVLLRAFSERFSGQNLLVLSLALAAVPFMALVQLQGAALRGFQSILQGELAQAILRPLCFLVLVGAIWIVAGRLTDASVALGLQVVAAGFAVLVGFILLRQHVHGTGGENEVAQCSSSWLWSAASLLFLNFLGILNTQTDILILGAIKGAEAVGLYRAALQMALLIPLPLVIAKIAIGPLISHLYAKGSRDKLQHVVTYGAILALLGSLPAASLFALGGNWLLSSLFGQEFAKGATALTVLSIGYFVSTIMGPVDLVLIMTGRETDAAKGMGLAALFNLFLNLIFIPIWGLNGAAIATATSQACWSIILAAWVYKKLRVNTTAVKIVAVKQVWNYWRP